jgi:hypothetical protein
MEGRKKLNIVTEGACAPAGLFFFHTIKNLDF